MSLRKLNNIMKTVSLRQWIGERKKQLREENFYRPLRRSMDAMQLAWLRLNSAMLKNQDE